MSILESFDLEDLNKINQFVSQYGDMGELKDDLGFIISSREKDENKSLNQKFDLDMMIKYQLFDYDELNVILMNSIMNLQDLIDCDLNQLVGITPSIKRKLEWVRTFYDMRSLDKKSPFYK